MLNFVNYRVNWSRTSNEWWNTQVLNIGIIAYFYSCSEKKVLNLRQNNRRPTEFLYIPWLGFFSFSWRCRNLYKKNNKRREEERQVKLEIRVYSLSLYLPSVWAFPYDPQNVYPLIFPASFQSMGNFFYIQLPSYSSKPTSWMGLATVVLRVSLSDYTNPFMHQY